MQILGGDIVAVVKPDTPDPDDDDLGALLLTHALVDAHTQTALVGLRGAGLEAAGDAPPCA